MASIFDLLLDIEGGYVNNPSDPGGETNFGISKKAYPKIDIKNLTRDEAIEIYRSDYYLKFRIDEIKNKDIALALLLAVVNGGQGMYNFIQKELGACDLIDTLNQEQDDSRIKLTIIHRYISLIDKNPKLSIFLRGWIKRRIFYEL